MPLSTSGISTSPPGEDITRSQALRDADVLRSGREPLKNAGNQKDE